MEYVGAIAVLVLTPILWILSHKYFRFIYFGNIGNAVLKEILECFFISILLVSVFGGVFKSVLSGVGSILLFILKAALIIAGIAIAVFLIAAIAKAISSKKSDGNDSCDSPPQNTAEQVNAENDGDEHLHESVPSEADDTEISRYIEEHFTSADYLKAIKYYREKTGADIETAKAAIDGILKGRN